MNRMVRNIIILVGVLAVIGGGFWWLIGYEPATEENTATESPEYTTVYKVEEENIASIEMADSDEVIRFVRDGDKWTIAGYSSDKLAQSKVSGFVSAVSSLTSKNLISEPPASCGLDAPATVVTVEKTDGSKDIIKIGDMSAVLEEYFFNVNDGDIYTMPSYKANSIRNSIDYYTSFSRVTVNTAEVYDVKIEREKNTLHIGKMSGSDGSMTAWEVLEPFGTAYNANDTYIEDNILAPMGKIDLSTPAEAGANTGLSKAKAVVTILSAPTDEEGNRGETAETVFKIGNTEGDKLYVEYNDEAFVTDASAFSFVNADEFLTVSKLLSLTSISTLDTMTVTAGDKKYVFEVRHTAMGEDEDKMTFIINGKAASEKKAKAIYQEVIGLPAEGTYKGEALGEIIAEISFASVGSEKNITFRKINDMSAAYTVDGVTEFTVRISTVENVLGKMAEFEETPA